MISIKNLSKNYKSKNEKFTALDEITLLFPNNGLFFITGESGSGKSTLLNIIGTLDDYDSGEIFIENLNINKLSKKQVECFRQNYIGYVFQQFNLIDELSIYDNVSISQDLANTNESEINELLKLLKLDKLKNKRINELSGGEQQRVAIARALIKKPKILLCDEPTGMLDDENSRLIFEIFKRISNNTLVIVVTHNINLAFQFSNNIIKLKNGKIIETVKTNENETSKILELEKPRNLNKDKIFKISFSWMFVRFKRLFVICFLFLILTVSSVFSLSFINRNNGKLIVKAFYNNDTNYLAYYKEYVYANSGNDINTNPLIGMNNNDLMYFKNNLIDFNGDVVYNYFISNYGKLLDKNNIYTRNYGKSKGYNTNKNNGIAVINQEFINKYDMSLYGNLPSTPEEVVITKYVFEQYKLSGYYDYFEKTIQNYDDMIGNYITLEDSKLKVTKNLKVVGILDTNLNEERYKRLLTSNENYGFIQLEWDIILEYGLHNIAYVSEEFINLILNDLSINQRIVLGNKIHNAWGFDGAISLEDNELEIYYSSQEEIKNGIIVPYNFSFDDNERLYENFEQSIKEFAKNHYQEIRDDFIEDGNYDNWTRYYLYIKGNTQNKYHSEYDYNFFKKQAITNYVNIIKDYYMDMNYLKIYLDDKELLEEIKVVGFYNVDGTGKKETASPICVSNELFNILYDKINYNNNQYKFLVKPINASFKKELKNYNFLDKKIYDKNILPNAYDNEYILYKLANENYVSFNNINNTLMLINKIILIVSMGLFIISSIILYYHYSEIIHQKAKSIGILYSLGISFWDIFKIFFIQFVLTITFVFLISIPILIMTFALLNKYTYNELYVLISIFKIDWFSVISLYAFYLVFGLIITYVIVKKHDKRKPIKTILSLT